MPRIETEGAVGNGVSPLAAACQLSLQGRREGSDPVSALDLPARCTLIASASWPDGRCRATGGGKSGLQGSTVAANGRRGRPQGKCNRKQTACREGNLAEGKGERVR